MDWIGCMRWSHQNAYLSVICAHGLASSRIHRNLIWKKRAHKHGVLMGENWKGGTENSQKRNLQIGFLLQNPQQIEVFHSERVSSAFSVDHHSYRTNHNHLNTYHANLMRTCDGWLYCRCTFNEWCIYSKRNCFLIENRWSFTPC